MGCNTANDEELAQALAKEFLAADGEQDAALARSLALGGSGIDQAFGRASGPVAAGVGQMQQQPFYSESSAPGMVHVACEVGDKEAEMLVDTGAQMSCVSEPLAAQLGILSRLDRTMQGMANGVGQAKILGQVFDVPVKLGNVEFALNFSVLAMQKPLLILGLDLMRQYKCLVDLERSCLVFGGQGGIEVPFLSSTRGSYPEPMDAVLVQGRRAVEMLKARVPMLAEKILDTLGRLLRNISSHPLDEKYRRLRGSNERLQREVLAHPEAVELLRLIGFAGDGDDLVLLAGTPLLALEKLTMSGGVLG